MKLLIVDDYAIVRKGIIAALSYEKIFDDIKEAINIEEGMKILRIERPEIAIIDIRLGHNENGLDIIEKANREKIATKFVVLTSSSRYADYALARELGVRGYVLKDSSIEAIVDALKVVIKGRQFFDSRLQEYSSKDIYEQIRSLLSERELEVLRALALGLTNAQIAEKLFITENTVKKHISNILSKLGFTHRTEAALYAASLWQK